ncbi:Putative transposase [Frankia alni ACN14a]|uniref:Transposase n=1 Tax=Frankia alni (strain DSM 45986 / CECT 9034 / ACN14a) TaxID=326424 RepID=Q0RUB5_FRAAA|nr:Putative transposase [Frankia alni ACN14a]
MTGLVAADSEFWFDNHWSSDATTVPGGMSRPTVRHVELAGSGYGYCASNSRFCRGLKLYGELAPRAIPPSAVWNPDDGRRLPAVMSGASQARRSHRGCPHLSQC